MNPEAPSLIKKKTQTNPKNPTLKQLSYTSDLSIFFEADLVFGLGCNSLLVIIIKLQGGVGERVSLYDIEVTHHLILISGMSHAFSLRLW